MKPAKQVIATNAQIYKQNAETTMGTDVFVKINITKKEKIAHLVCNSFYHIPYLYTGVPKSVKQFFIFIDRVANVQII